MIWADLIVIWANFLLKESENYVSRRANLIFFCQTYLLVIFFFLELAGPGPPLGPK